MKKLLATVAFALGMAATGAVASVGVNPAGGGNKFIYDLGGGERLGLVGLQSLSDNNVTLAELTAAVSSGNVLGWFFANPQSGDYGTAANRRGSWDGSPTEFTAFFDNDLTPSPDAVGDPSDKLFDALWVKYTGEVVFSGTNTFGLNDRISLDGLLSPIPVPAALPLLALGLGGLGLAARRQRRKAD